MLFPNGSDQEDSELILQKNQQLILESIRTAHYMVSKMNSQPSQLDSFPVGTLINGVFTDTLIPSYDPHANYYQEFWKVYVKNDLQIKQLRLFFTDINSLKHKLSEIEIMEENHIQSLKLRNKKKNRRLANQIEKNFKCPYKDCYKTYGSDVSLNLHMKIKHNGGNKTDREKLAQEICLSQIGKCAAPKIEINFPPGFLENFRKEFLKNGSKVQIMN